MKEALPLNKIEISPLTGLPIIKEGDDLALLICQAAEKQETSIQNGDIIVVTHVVVSRAEGNVVNLETVTPSTQDSSNLFSENPKASYA